MSRAAFDRLLEGLADAFQAEGRPGGRAAAEALHVARGRSWRPRAGMDPGVLLDRAAALPGAGPLAADVLASRGMIAWTRWGAGTLDPHVSDALHTAELAGPDGHVQVDAVRIGLLVSAPDTDYPVSSHSGEETYLVLSGTAEWTVNGSGYAARPPGSIIHHPAHVPHGRRTGAEPFLGAWRWSGDLDLSSFRVEGQP